MRKDNLLIEWPTVALAVLCYAVFILSCSYIAHFSITFAILGAGLSIALHSSLSHEALHGHPFRSELANTALVFPALSLCVPYLRFKRTHLDHHYDPILTDPYDDPETGYMDPAVWHSLPAFLKAIFRVNNTLMGRLVIGPVVGQIGFMYADWKAIRAGQRDVFWGWVWHIPAALIVVLYVHYLSVMPMWAFLGAVYMGHSILKLRTFLEHQAHEQARARTVIVEDRGVFAFLFLNNNFHVVHHMHPKVPWYRLPKLYFNNRQGYLDRNESYVYRSYAEIFRRYLFVAKEPVPHPLWPNSKD